jgi:hypothetical protein
MFSSHGGCLLTGATYEKLGRPDAGRNCARPASSRGLERGVSNFQCSSSYIKILRGLIHEESDMMGIFRSSLVLPAEALFVL